MGVSAVNQIQLQAIERGQDENWEDWSVDKRKKHARRRTGND